MVFGDDLSKQADRQVVIFLVERRSRFFKSILIKCFTIVHIFCGKHFGFVGFSVERPWAPFQVNILLKVRRYSDKPNLRSGDFGIFEFNDQVIVSSGNIKEAVASLAANLLPIQKDPAARVQKQIESKRPGVADCLAAYLNISEKSKTGNSGSRYSSLSQTHAGPGDPQENKKEQALLQFDFHEISKNNWRVRTSSYG